MTIKGWINVTNDLLKFRREEVLNNSGDISHKELELYKIKNIYLQWMNSIINILMKIKVIFY